MKEPFISVLISEEKLNERIAQLGEQISKDYEGKEVKLICILKGSIIFTCELAKRITVPVKFDFMQVSSYGSGTSSSGQIKIKKDLDESIEGEHVIVIEDIIDSGNTLARLMPMLEERKPADICICTLLDKPERREVEEVGHGLRDEFVGDGLFGLILVAGAGGKAGGHIHQTVLHVLKTDGALALFEIGRAHV